MITRLDDFVSPYAEGSDVEPAAPVTSTVTGERFVCAAASLLDGVSFEEQREQDSKTRSRGPPVVKKLGSSLFGVTWVPSRAGEFLLHLKVNGQDISGSPVKVTVTATAAAIDKPSAKTASTRSRATQVDDGLADEEMQTASERLYCTSGDGLVLRAGPSLDTIEMGKVGKGASIECTGEVLHSEEGRWVRVAQATVDQFVDADLRFMDTWAPVFFYEAFGGELCLSSADPSAKDPTADSVLVPGAC